LSTPIWVIEALAQREDWLDLFPFLTIRRAETCAALVRPVHADKPYGAS
jgi:N-carbamoylputrescine amidase